jgi:hypothetical protein
VKRLLEERSDSMINRKISNAKIINTTDLESIIKKQMEIFDDDKIISDQFLKNNDLIMIPFYADGIKDIFPSIWDVFEGNLKQGIEVWELDVNIADHVEIAASYHVTFSDIADFINSSFFGEFFVEVSSQLYFFISLLDYSFVCCSKATAYEIGLKVNDQIDILSGVIEKLEVTAERIFFEQLISKARNTATG